MHLELGLHVMRHRDLFVWFESPVLVSLFLPVWLGVRSLGNAVLHSRLSLCFCVSAVLSDNVVDRLLERTPCVCSGAIRMAAQVWFVSERGARHLGNQSVLFSSPS